MPEKETEPQKTYPKIMTSLTKLKQADTRSKDAVFGYSRLCSNELLINIPMMVQYLFLAYYWIYDKFTIHGDGLIVASENYNLIRNVSRSSALIWNTVYGRQGVINYNDTSIIKYEWIFRFKKTDDPLILFGFDSSNGECINEDFSDNSINKEQFIVVGDDGNTYCSAPMICKSLTKSMRQLHVKGEGIVHIILDIQRKMALCAFDGSEQEHEFGENIPIDKHQFSIAIAIPTRKQTEVDLLDFKMYQK